MNTEAKLNKAQEELDNAFKSAVSSAVSETILEEYLKNNLSIRICAESTESGFTAIKVSLYLCGKEISFGSDIIF